MTLTPAQLDSKRKIEPSRPCPEPPKLAGAQLNQIVAAVERAAANTCRQATLSDDLFPPVKSRDVPTVKITISGTIELTSAEYEGYLSGASLGPGAVVDVRAAGYVVQPGVAWVRRTETEADGERRLWHEREGRVRVKLTELAAIDPTGEEFIG